MAQSTYIARKGEDADLGNTTVTGTLAVSGQATITNVTCTSADIAGAVEVSGAVTVGENGTGYDVTLYSDTTGCSLVWDQSEDQLVVTGPADVPALALAGAGSISPETYAASGTAWADGATPGFVADQKYLRIKIAGTVYRIPLWADE